jgi:2-polyprenyl-6-methoxyphenol hydroxylase-like FAD-dependent oxidoreductase
MPEVTIIGAGATGCTLALVLSRYGIASTVLERRGDTFNHPAAHVINARSLEIWHRASPTLSRVNCTRERSGQRGVDEQARDLGRLLVERAYAEVLRGGCGVAKQARTAGQERQRATRVR